MSDKAGRAAGARTAPPFFVVGCPRSGTTLTSQLLDSHPSICVLVETLFYPLVRSSVHWYGDLSKAANARSLLSDLRELMRLHHGEGLGLPSVSDLLDRIERPDFSGCFAAFVELFAELQGKTCVGEKTARNYEYMSQIEADFPSSPVIFVVRDPRDVFASAKPMFGVGPHQVVSWWNEAFDSWDEKRRRDPTHVHLLRYERLVQNPVEELTSLCTLLGQPFDPEMLSFAGRVPAALAGLSHHRKLTTSIDSASVGSFKDLSRHELEVIEVGTARGMRALGYERATAASAVPGNPRVGHLGDRVRRVARIMKRRERQLSVQRWKLRTRARLRHALHLR